jgi:hypothetical protein
MSAPSAEQVAQARALGMEPDEFAARQRRAGLRDSRDPELLLPAIREELALAAKVERIVKTAADPAVYRVETDGGVVKLGPASRWINRPGEFRAAFLDTLGESVPRLRGAQWDDLCSLIARAAVVEDVGDEATLAGLGRAWLADYLARAAVVEVAEYDEASGAACIRRDDELHVIGKELRRWVRLTSGDHVSYAHLGDVLRAAGAEPARLDVVHNGERRQLRTWRVPT